MKSLVTMREALSDPALLGNVLPGDSWAAWRVLLIAVMGEPLAGDERAVFQRLTNRPREPQHRAEEFWGVIGRRGGKTRAAATLAAYLSGLCDHSDSLVRGERGLLLFLAANQKQASVAFNYTAAIFDEGGSLLSGLVRNRTADILSLNNGVDLEVRAASFRGLRGVTAVGVIGDEAAFWPSDETSANADSEILNAVRPALATTAGPLIVISSPYARRGAVYDAFRAHYGAEGDPAILVAKGASRDFNPSLPQSVVDRAYERDAAAASAEYGGEFRNDLEAFVSRETLDALVDCGVTERPPIAGVQYVGFCDPSGGSSDSMTMAVAHLESGAVVLDCVRERRAPFAPDGVVVEFAATLLTYGIRAVRGDRYGGEWPRERFKHHGIDYFAAALVKSEIYGALLPVLNSGRARLLDNERMVAQLAGLERRTGRGRDIIDHRPGAKDDVANAVAGAIVLAQGAAQQCAGVGIVVGGRASEPFSEFGGRTRYETFDHPGWH